MSKKSAGILLVRFKNKSPEFLLVHPGGPFWEKKDLGAWSIPKGEFSENENPLEAAKREFKEETGMKVSGEFIPLAPLKQKSGKIIYAWALQGNIDAQQIRSNLFKLEWPPRSGTKKYFPEINRAEWFDINVAKLKIQPGQLGFIEDWYNRIVG